MEKPKKALKKPSNCTDDNFTPMKKVKVSNVIKNGTFKSNVNITPRRIKQFEARLLKKTKELFNESTKAKMFLDQLFGTLAGLTGAIKQLRSLNNLSYREAALRRYDKIYEDVSGSHKIPQKELKEKTLKEKTCKVDEINAIISMGETCLQETRALTETIKNNTQILNKELIGKIDESIRQIKKFIKLVDQGQSNIKHLSNLVDNQYKRETASRVSVKRHTVRGDEYQRTLQILLRQKGLSSPESSVGIEVSGVGSFDDIVYSPKNGVYKFFQAKYTTNKIPIKHAELFKDKLSPTPDKGLNLLLYFESFCKIKDNESFRNSVIEEITLITNRDIEIKTQNQEKELLNLKSKNLNRDECLYLRGMNKARKYYLHLKNMETEFGELLTGWCKDIFLKDRPEIADKVVQEFLEKICIVVNYPDLNELKRLVFQEVFNEDIFQCKNKEILEDCLTHIEIRLLINKSEFVSSETWNNTKNKLKEFLEGLKATGIVDMNSKRLSSAVSFVEFESISDMFNDIHRFIQRSGTSIFNCVVRNLKLNALKVLRILKQINKNCEIPGKYKTPLYCDLEDLLVADFLLKSFESNTFNLLVMTCEDRYDGGPLIKNLENVLNNPEKKAIIIAEAKNNFADELCNSTQGKYIKKEYNHGFRHLTSDSKDKILSKPIDFQGHKMQLRNIFNNNEDFADKVIDENCLWEIIETDSRKTISLSNRESLSSPGYNEKYYIPRNFSQTLVTYDTLKTCISSDLFCITGTRKMPLEDLEERLIKNGIKGNFIKKWIPSKRSYHDPITDKLSLEKGILLFDNRVFSDEETTPYEVKLDKKNVHFLFMNSHGQFILLESRGQGFFGQNLVNETEKKSVKEDDTVYKLNDHDETLILVGDSGVGKSTVLTRLANKIKENDTRVWISKVNLGRFFSESKLQNSRNIDQALAVDSVVKMTLGNDSTCLENNLLREGLKISEISHNFRFILFLDGYNEIKKSSQVEIVNVVQIIQNSCNINQIWITTQIQEKIHLEKSLGVAAHFLNVLSDEEQRKLMAGFWATEYSTFNNDDEELLQDAKKALECWKESIRDEDEKTFTQVSLNLIMLADVLLETNRKFDKSLNLLQLYDRFVERKFKIHKRETAIPISGKRTNQFIDDAKEKVFQKMIREVLQELSVTVIFGKYQLQNDIKKLPGMKALKDFEICVDKDTSEKILSKIGILTLKQNKSFDFSHYSFAQLFFSEYLIKHLNETKLQSFFTSYVLTENSLQLCRRFFNDNLNKQSVCTKQCRNIEIVNMDIRFKKTSIGNLWKKSTDLYIPVKEKLEHVIKFLIKGMDDNVYHRYLKETVGKDFEYYRSQKQNIIRSSNLIYFNVSTFFEIDFVEFLKGQPKDTVPGIIIDCKLVGKRVSNLDHVVTEMTKVCKLMRDKSLSGSDSEVEED